MNKKILAAILVFSFVFVIANTSMAAEQGDVVWGVSAGDEFEWTVNTFFWEIEQDFDEEIDDEVEGELEDIPFKQGDTIKVVIDQDLPTNLNDPEIGDPSDYFTLYINDEVHVEEDMLAPILPLQFCDDPEVGMEDTFDVMEEEMTEAMSELDDELDTLRAELDALFAEDDADGSYTLTFTNTINNNAKTFEFSFNFVFEIFLEYVGDDATVTFESLDASITAEGKIVFDKETGALKSITLDIDASMTLIGTFETEIFPLSINNYLNNAEEHSATVKFNLDIGEKGTGILDGLPIDIPFNWAYGFFAITAIGIATVLLKKKH